MKKFVKIQVGENQIMKTVKIDFRKIRKNRINEENLLVKR